MPLLYCFTTNPLLFIYIFYRPNSLRIDAPPVLQEYYPPDTTPFYSSVNQAALETRPKGRMCSENYFEGKVLHLIKVLKTTKLVIASQFWIRSRHTSFASRCKKTSGRSLVLLQEESCLRISQPRAAVLQSFCDLFSVSLEETGDI